VTLMMFGGWPHRQITAASAWSLYKAWPAIPERVLLVTDNSISPDDYRAALNWWPGPVDAISASEVVATHAAAGREDLVRFATSKRNILGLKLAAISFAAERGPVLAVDTDILWFKALPEGWLVPPSEHKDELIVRTMEDFQAAYDDRLMDQKMASVLSSPPYRNSGVVYVRGDLVGNAAFQEVVARAAVLDYSQTTVGGFAEQTVLAWVSATTNTSPWSLDTIYISMSRDGQKLASYARKTWAARHYVSPIRWLFWEDALALPWIRPE
jgi:hypothetical protein